MTESKGWDAVFADGPMSEGDHDRHFVGALPDTLYFAPRPAFRSAGGQQEYMWVGDKHVPPEFPWEGQLKYVAIDEIPPATEGGTVRFRLESE